MGFTLMVRRYLGREKGVENGEGVSVFISFVFFEVLRGPSRGSQEGSFRAAFLLSSHEADHSGKISESQCSKNNRHNRHHTQRQLTFGRSTTARPSTSRTGYRGVGGGRTSRS